jgi:hypothetical protein
MSQYLEQAARAERLARGVLDKSAFEALMSYASECREKAARSAELPVSPTVNPMTASPVPLHEGWLSD